MNSPSFSFLTGLSVTKKLKCHGKKNIIWHYFDPWMRIARSLVIFPDSTTPTQALSRASVKPSNLMLLSSFALYLKIILTPTNFALRVLLSDLSVYFDIKYAQRIPMWESSGPCKNRSNAVCAGLATFLMYPKVARDSTMCSFRFNCFSIRANL